MKFTSALALSSLTFANANSVRNALIKEASGPSVSRNMEQSAQDYTCTGGQDYSIYFKGKCDYDSLVARMNLKVSENDRCVNSGAKEVQLLVGIIAGASDPSAVHDAKKKVETMCHAAMDAVMENPNKVRMNDDVNSMSICMMQTLMSLFVSLSNDR